MGRAKCLAAWERPLLHCVQGRSTALFSRSIARVPDSSALPAIGTLYKIHPKEGANMTTLKEKHPHSEREEHHVDKAVEDTFPASDPPSTGGVTRLEPDKKKEQEQKDASK
jgi:hypothetical protein